MVHGQVQRYVHVHVVRDVVHDVVQDVVRDVVHGVPVWYMMWYRIYEVAFSMPDQPRLHLRCPKNDVEV